MVAALRSLEQVRGLVGSACLDCEGIGWSGIYAPPRRKGNVAIFRCSFSGNHLRKYNIAFGIGEEELAGLAQKMQTFLARVRAAPGRIAEHFYEE